MLFEGGPSVDLERKAAEVRFTADLGSIRLRLFEVLVTCGVAAPIP